MNEEISKIAYFKWLNAGKPEGMDNKFWKEAENEYHWNGRIQQHVKHYLPIDDEQLTTMIDSGRASVLNVIDKIKKVFKTC